MSKFEDDVKNVLHEIAKVLRLDHLHDVIDTAGKETEVPENASE